MTNEKMKKIFFLPIILLSTVVIAVSLFSISGQKEMTNNNERVVEPQLKEEIITFNWQEGEKPVLLMSASKEVSIGAIDLYIGYKGVDVVKVNNLSELPKPAFFKISEKNNLIVINYLISEDEGFKLSAGQSVRVMELELSSELVSGAQLVVDEKTNVVENDTVEMVPYKSENLIIKSSFE